MNAKLVEVSRAPLALWLTARHGLAVTDLTWAVESIVYNRAYDAELHKAPCGFQPLSFGGG